MPRFPRLPPLLRAALFWIALAALGFIAVLGPFLAAPRDALPTLLAFTASVALVAVGVTMFLVRLRAYQGLLPERDGDPPLGLSDADATRARRLRIARRFLPPDPPPGWSVPVVHGSLNAWRITVGDVLVLAWSHLEEHGPHFSVAMLHPDLPRPVPDARAKEILAHFRGVTAFMECANVPRAIEDPDARCWTSLGLGTVDALASQPTPRPPRAVVEPPLDKQLQVLRRFLPEKLPSGWSPYLAMTDTPDVWQIQDEDVAIVVGLCRTQTGIKLGVTLFRRGRDETPIDYGRAACVLEHFRNVREFVQVPSDDDLPHACTYLAPIDARAEARDRPN